MIYLKNLNSQVREFKETDMRTVDSMVDSGRWTRVKGLKDWTPYSKPKKTKKKATKKRVERMYGKDTHPKRRKRKLIRSDKTQRKYLNRSE